MEVRNFINGNFVDSFSKQNIRVVNPADQTDVGFIDEALDNEIEFAFDAASQAHQKKYEIRIVIYEKHLPKLPKGIKSIIRRSPVAF